MPHRLECHLLSGLTALPEQVGTLEAGPGGAGEGAADLGEPLPDLLDQRQDGQEGAVGGKALLRAGLDGVAEVVTDGLAGQVVACPAKRSSTCSTCRHFGQPIEIMWLHSPRE